MALQLNYPLGSYSTNNPPSNQTLIGDLVQLQDQVNFQEDEIAAKADAGSIPTIIHSATSKTTPIDADELALIDSASSNSLAKLTWANLKATLKAYTDTLYLTTTSVISQRVNPRSVSTSSSATPAINTDTTDFFALTSLAVAITSMTSGLSGTPVNGQHLTIRIKDDGTARAIAWGASFASRGATLPTTTVLGKYLYVGLIYNSAALVWDCVAVAQE